MVDLENGGKTVIGTTATTTTSTTTTSTTTATTNTANIGISDKDVLSNVAKIT